jgi:hypothetical protein
VLPLSLSLSLSLSLFRYVDAPQLHTALMTAGINIGAQEVITIIRKLSDASGDGNISVELFFQEVFGAAFS